MTDAAAANSAHVSGTCSTEDIAAILQTSGATGRPNGAMLTHDDLLSNARALADLWCCAADDVLPHALPIFHTHGLFVAVSVSALAGVRTLFHPDFSLDRILADLPSATALMPGSSSRVARRAPARWAFPCPARSFGSPIPRPPPRCLPQRSA